MSTTNSGVLTIDESSGNSGADYVLAPGATSCWITVDGFAVYIKREVEGIVVDVYAHRAANETTIASTYAYHSDAEATLCSSKEIDIDNVAEWVGLHYKVNFDSESGPKRHEWITRYIDAHAESSKSNPEEKSDYETKLIKISGMGDIVDDVDQPGKFVWLGADISFDSKEEATRDLLREITGHVMGVADVSSDFWDSLSDNQKLEIAKDVYGEEEKV